MEDDKNYAKVTIRRVCARQSVPLCSDLILKMEGEKVEVCSVLDKPQDILVKKEA
jgi:hypothetical protein